MKTIIADYKHSRARDIWFVIAIVTSVLAVGLTVVSVLFEQSDTFVLATGFILLLSATVSGVMNLFRSRAVSARIAANKLALQLHEKALEEHTIVSITGHDGKVIEVNQNFCETFGYAVHEMIGQTPCILYPEDTNKTVHEEMLSTIRDGNVWTGPQRLRSKAGKSVTVQTSIFPKADEYGAIREFVTIQTDLSDALAESAKSGRHSVIEALPDGVFIYDPESFAISYGNETFRKRVGWATDVWQPISVTSLFSEDELKLFRRYLMPLIHGEATRTVFEFQHDSGPVEVVTHLVEDVDGKRNLVSVVRDIEERKKAEQLKLSSVSTVSHELRTPLTSIKGALRLLESGVMGQLSPDVTKLVGVAHRNSERLLAIVNDILTLEELHFGEMAIKTKNVDLRDILNEAAEANATYAAECNVSFVVDTTLEPAFVHADPDRLMQVMSNLMSNAAKFSPSGSGVNLRILDHASSWRVCVEDKGPGIPESAREKLFDSFIQAETMHEKAIPSTGLGLTICREIIRRHGGRIAFDTEVGQGSTFYFELEKSAEIKRSADLSAVA
jgi:PAS domain S-box-containing protein